MTILSAVRGRTLLRLLFMVGTAVSLLSGATPVEGQGVGQVTITGTILGEDGNRPLSGAWLAFSTGDTVRARTATDLAGSYNIVLPEAGTYVVSAKLLGYADWTSGPLEILEDRSLDLLLPLSPIPLEGVLVEGTSACRASPADLRAGTDLLRILEPVLREIDRNSALEGYDYVMELSRPKKKWSRGTWRWLGRDTLRFRTDAVLVIEPPEVLDREGYAVSVDDSTNLYRAPGPGTLSSERFRTTHCISRIPGDTAGVIGLAFEPKEDGDILDVKGTLWVDAGTGVPIPRRLEFTYVNLVPHLEERHLPWLLAWFREEAEPHRQIEVGPVDPTRGEYGGFLVFREVREGFFLITEWEVDQLSLGYGALWSGWKGLRIDPWVTGLPTTGRLIALLPRRE